jgi:hypothetical protein
MRARPPMTSAQSPPAARPRATAACRLSVRVSGSATSAASSSRSAQCCPRRAASSRNGARRRASTWSTVRRPVPASVGSGPAGSACGSMGGSGGMTNVGPAPWPFSLRAPGAAPAAAPGASSRGEGRPSSGASTRSSIGRGARPIRSRVRRRSSSGSARHRARRASRILSRCSAESRRRPAGPTGTISVTCRLPGFGSGPRARRGSRGGPMGCGAPR